jgi:hypothetical protein
MNKITRILYQSAIIANILAGITSLLTRDYLLGVNQFLVSWFMFMFYKEKNK